MSRNQALPEHKSTRFDRPLLDTASRHSGPQKTEIKGMNSSIHECLSSNTEEHNSKADYSGIFPKKR